MLRSLVDLRAVPRHPEPVDARNGLLGDPPQRLRIEADGFTARLVPWNTADLEDVRQTPRRVGAAAEAEKIDAVAWLPYADERDVAIDNLLRMPNPNICCTVSLRRLQPLLCPGAGVPMPGA